MYERNHNLIPELEKKDFSITLMNGRTDEAEDNAIELDFESLVKLGGEEVTTLLSCGGNKRKQVQ
jgi:hypothetical protein